MQPPWDAADRLVTITNKQTGHTSQFAYDGLSLRISDTEMDSGGTPVTTHYLWCGTHLCEARDSSDNVLARYYAQGELQGSTIAYYAQDQVGSVVATVNPQGQITARLKYDSYGNLIKSSGTLPDYRYAGLFYHPASGLSLATWRAYDPKIGRWLSRDPIRELGGVNLYGYVENNPLSWIDPNGLNPALGAIGGGMVAGPPGAVIGGIIGFGIGIYIGDKIFNMDGSSDSPDGPNPTAPIPAGPADSPGEGWKWKGSGTPESGKGNWVNPETGQKIHPDLNHPDPKGPHWGLTNPDGSKWDYFPDTGKWEQCK